MKDDVMQQREQLYRKLDALRSQGIELGPNFNVIKDPNVGLVTTAPNAYHQMHATGSSSITAPSADKLFYPSDHSTPDGGVLAVGGPSITTDKSGITPPGSTLMPHNTSSSAIGVRKTSSMSGVSSASIGNQATSVATGGSLKKDSFAANLHLMSATNETKQSVVGIEKQEIQQKIPEKLVSKLSVSTRGSVSTSRLSSMGGSERMSKKNLVGISSNSSGISPSGDRASGAGPAVVGNLVKPDTVSQLLPFKLSEASKEASQHQFYPGPGVTLQIPTTQQGSPGRQKLSSSSFGDSSSTSKLSSLSHHQPQYNTLHQPQLQHSARYQYAPNPLHSLSPNDQINTTMRQRTGSSPHLAASLLVPTSTTTSFGAGSGVYNYKQVRQPPIQQMPNQQRSNSNTLPKKDGKQQKDVQKINYSNRASEVANRVGGGDKHSSGNTSEDKVIYF